MTAVTRARGPDPALTVAQVAEELGTSPPTVWRRIKAGELRAVNIGAGARPRLRVRRSALEEYLAAREVRPITRGRGRRAA